MVHPMNKIGRNTAAAAGLVLLLAHADMPLLAAGFVAPSRIAAHTLPRPPPWSHPTSPSSAGDTSSLASTSRHTSAAAQTRTLSANCNNNDRRSRSYARTPPATTCCAAGSSATSENTPPTGKGGSRVGPSSAGSSPTAVAAAAVTDVGNAHQVVAAGLIPAEEAAAGGRQEGGRITADGWAPAVEEGLVREFEWEGGAGAAWTEFEDWLIQDTYSRYAIGSGKHVLWRRMVREVPELMERTPQEVRQRWLRLTGRIGGGSGEGARGERAPGSPALDAFYVQPPVLEQWEEIVEGEGMGSFRGNVFGQRGLADGTAMTTAPVDVSGRKIQDQYVATQCGVVYELGERCETDLVGQASSKMLKIAPATVAALAGAFYALTALSHHVQVEVFVI